MNKRKFFQRSLLSLLGLSIVPINAKANLKNKRIEGKFIHMVFFWLNEETDATDFVKSTEAFLKQVDEIKQYHLGHPAMTPRDVVDNSYTVSLVVTFNSKEDQNIYQEHPAHIQYIEDNKMKWREVRVFDSWSAL